MHFPSAYTIYRDSRAGLTLLPIYSDSHCTVVMPYVILVFLMFDFYRASAWNWYSNSVCPSVCLSRSGVCLTHRRNFFTINNSPIILVLWVSNICAKFRRVTTCGGAKCRWGIKISRFSTNISQTIQDSATRNANRNWYAIYRMMRFPMTSRDRIT